MNASAPLAHRSLTRQLLLWSLSALALVWAVFVGAGYFTAVHEADELTDGHLASVAALLSNVRRIELLADSRGAERRDMPWLKSHDYQQSLSVVVWNSRGDVLARTGAAELPQFSVQEGLSDVHLGSESKHWRAFTQWDVQRERKIMVLLAAHERDALVQDIAEQMIGPGLWLLPVVSLALGLALHRGLRPLYALASQVQALSPDGVQRLNSGHEIRELQPMVNAIHVLLHRQQAALQRERQLAHEIAHELRTPLSSVALQASALAGTLTEVEREKAQQRIHLDALRAGHVLDQLLTLASASRMQLEEAQAWVDLGDLARRVCAEFAQTAWQHQSELELQAPGSLQVLGHAVMLETALRNLLENAFKHTPVGTHVSVTLSLTDADHAGLQVSDDGGRIASGSVAVRSHPRDSLHLGHEIVRRVAQMHGGEFVETAPKAPFSTAYRLVVPVQGLASHG